MISNHLTQFFLNLVASQRFVHIIAQVKPQVQITNICADELRCLATRNIHKVECARPAIESILLEYQALAFSSAWFTICAPLASIFSAAATSLLPFFRSVCWALANFFAAFLALAAALTAFLVPPAASVFSLLSSFTTVASVFLSVSLLDFRTVLALVSPSFSAVSLTSSAFTLSALVSTSAVTASSFCVSSAAFCVDASAPLSASSLTPAALSAWP